MGGRIAGSSVLVPHCVAFVLVFGVVAAACGDGRRISRLMRCVPVALAAFLVTISCTLVPTPSPVAAPDPLSAARSCVSGMPDWTVENFPPGARDLGLGPRGQSGVVRLLLPESVANGRGRSQLGGGTFVTDWWTVTPHDETTITFADGSAGKQYRSKGTPPQITTEFTNASGTWHVHTRSADAAYDELTRCLQGRLASGAR